MVVHPNGKGLRVVRRSDNRFELFKPVWSPDGRKFLVGCFWPPLRGSEAARPLGWNLGR